MTSPRAVADELRARILELSYAPGTPLREIALADELGCSRRTAREALLTLGAEGLVTHERNRGAAVRSFTEADIRDLYLVRRTLELAGAAACVTASEEQLARAADSLAALDAAARAEQDSAAHAVADMRFHGSIIALLGSPRFDAVFERIGSEMAYAIRLLQRNEVTERVDVEWVVGDHRRIFDAVAARDPDAATRAVATHIDENEAILIGLFA